jgi:hypothetical protein
MKYAIQIGSCSMIHTKFHKDRFSHLKADRWGYTDSMVISYAYFNFSKIRKAG